MSPLRGENVPQQRETQPDVVAVLEKALERARAGEIQSVAIAWQWWDRMGGWDAAGVANYPLIGALAHAQQHTLARMK